MAHIIINGIVSHRDTKPYIQIMTEQGVISQLSMADARNIAMNIMQMCARTEADAMIWKFFAKADFPESAGAALMKDFRDFRSELDAEAIETAETDPDA